MKRLHIATFVLVLLMFVGQLIVALIILFPPVVSCVFYDPPRLGASPPDCAYITD